MLGARCRVCRELVIPLDEIKPGDAMKRGWHTRRRAAALRHYKAEHPEQVHIYFSKPVLR